MDAIMGVFGAKNPIDDAMMERIKEITQRVLEVFGKMYLLSMKDVLLEKAEEKVALREKIRTKTNRKRTKYGDEFALAYEETLKEKYALEKKDEAESITEEEKSRRVIERAKRYVEEGKKTERPRVGEPAKPKPKIKCKVTNWQIYDGDIDAFVSYTLTSSYNGREGVVDRRYSDFKALHKKLGKKAPKNAELPKANSKFGTRNTTTEFIVERKKKLGKYIKKLCKCDDLTDDEDLHEFLGLVLSKDPLGDEIFDEAVQRTKRHFWIWKPIMYNEPVDGLSKIVIEEIKRAVWHDIVAACPPSERVRRAALKAAYRTICTVVDPAVRTAWEAAESGTRTVRTKVTEILGTTFEVVVESKSKLRVALTEGASKATAQIVEELGGIIGEAVGEILPDLFEPLTPFFKELDEKQSELIKAFNEGDEGKVGELGAGLGAAKEKLEKDMNKSLKHASKKFLGKKVKLDTLKDVFGPLGSLAEIVDSIFAVIDPMNWMSVMQYLLKRKKEIAGLDPSKPKEVEEALDDMEWWGIYIAQMASYDISWAGWNARYELSQLLDGLEPVAELIYDLARAIARRLHYRVLKRFALKFGDYLWCSMVRVADTRDWKTKVDEAFVRAYRSAINRAWKEMGCILVEYTSGLFKRPLLSVVTKEILPKLEEVTKPLEDTLPDPAKEVLDINGFAESVVVSIITTTCDTVVRSTAPSFLSAYTAARGEPLASLPSAPSSSSSSSAAAAAAAAATADPMGPLESTAPTASADFAAPTAPTAPAAPTDTDSAAAATVPEEAQGQAQAVLDSAQQPLYDASVQPTF